MLRRIDAIERRTERARKRYARKQNRDAVQRNGEIWPDAARGRPGRRNR
jgi:hypothetical protein